MIDPTAQVHPQAVIDVSATVGARTTVWQFASVIRSAVVGEDCSVASCAIIDGSGLGDRCSVGHGAFIPPGVVVDDDVFIGPYAQFCNDTWPRTSKDNFDLSQMIEKKFVTVKVGQGASLGANVIVLPGITIGCRAMVAAGAIVDRSVPSGCIFKRTGSIAKIDYERFDRRVREASWRGSYTVEK